MEKIAVVHPSRDRPDMAMKTLKNLEENMITETPVSYLLSLDIDDPKLDEYFSVFGLEKIDHPFAEPVFGGDGVLECYTSMYKNGASWITVDAVVSANNNIVEATNRGYCKQFVDDATLTIIHSDDMRLSEGWDKELLDLCKQHGLDKLFKTLQPGQEQPDLVTLQIAGREFWKSYGHFFYPGYLSLYGDNDVTEYAKINGKWVDAKHLVFPHLHFSIELPEDVKEKYGERFGIDDTYKREADQQKIQVGIMTFKRRISNGFTE